MFYNTNKYLSIAILFVGLILTGCGDDGNSTGPDQGEAPKAPEIQEKIKADVSFFQENSPKVIGNDELSESDNFRDAQFGATAGAASVGFGAYFAVFTQIGEKKAEYKDGMWIWTYSYGNSEGSLEYKTTAKELSNGSTDWALYYSISDGETNINNYKWFDGNVSADESEGHWTFNIREEDSNQETPLITSTWKIFSETKKDLTYESFDEGTLAGTVKYEQDTPNFKMTISSVEDPDVVIIIWNTDTKTGSYSEGGNKRCWDNSLQNNPC